VNVLCGLVWRASCGASRIPVVGTRPRRPTDEHGTPSPTTPVVVARVRRGERDCAPVRRWFSSAAGTADDGGEACTVARRRNLGGVLRHLTIMSHRRPGSSLLRELAEAPPRPRPCAISSGW